MKQSKQSDARVPMYPRSAGLGVVILATLVIVGIMATFIVTAF